MKNIIIFSGYNQRAVIAFLRTLKKNKINNYGIIAASFEDTILKTAYAEKVLYVRKKQQLDLRELEKAISVVNDTYQEKESIIIPSTEALNRFVLLHREFFESLGCIIPLVDKALYEKISDKESFWTVCRQNGLRVPELISIGEQYTIPFVAKPKTYFSLEGKVYSPIIVKNETVFEEFMAMYNGRDFDYQEYIEGKSYYLLFYFTKEGEIYKFSQENYVQQPGGKSILAAVCSDLHTCDTITVEYEQLFLNMGFYGFLMIELRKREDKFYMIEANPRLWGPSQLFCDAGYNFFEFFLKEQGFIKYIQEQKVDYQAKYFWSGGVNGRIGNEDSHMYLGDGKIIVSQNADDFSKWDIYRRIDTMQIYNFEEESKNDKKL